MFYKQADAEAASTAERNYQTTGKAVDYKTYSNSNKYLNLVGDAALVGVGAGTGWYALKKLVERAYQKKLERAVRQNAAVPTAYKLQDMPIQNDVIGADLTKYAGTTTFTDSDLRKGYTTNDVRRDGREGTTLFLNPNQGLRNAVTTEMASNPYVWNALAFASIPAVFGGAMWAGHNIAKKISKGLDSEEVLSLEEERRKARKRYEETARLLHHISNDEI